MRVRLHPIRQVLAGMILFSWPEAESVLRGYADAIADAPDELSVLAGMLSAPDGSPVECLAPMWSGEGTQGEEWIVRLRQLGTPLIDQVGPIGYRDWLDMLGAAAPVGRHYAAQTRSLAALSPDVISTLVAAGQQRSSPFSAIILHHSRGAATRVPLVATAFGLRKDHFMVEIIAAWEPTADGDGSKQLQWARTVSESLAPHALPGGYPTCWARTGMNKRKLDLGNVRVIAEWTIHGERAHFSIIFPPEEHFTVGTVGGKDEMRFRIEVFNSVDGSCRLIAIAGWLRFVCTNGLIIGTALMQLQEQHRQQLEVGELGRRIGEAIESTWSDKAKFERWMSVGVEHSVLL
jgi:hypothetical protein